MLKPLHSLRYLRWFTGDVIHLNIFGMRLIVLNTAAAASALLDKRSAAYANRPWFTMLNEMYVALTLYCCSSDVDRDLTFSLPRSWRRNPALWRK